MCYMSKYRHIQQLLYLYQIVLIWSDIKIVISRSQQLRHEGNVFWFLSDIYCSQRHTIIHYIDVTPTNCDTTNEIIHKLLYRIFQTMNNFWIWALSLCIIRWNIIIIIYFYFITRIITIILLLSEFTLFSLFHSSTSFG